MSCVCLNCFEIYEEDRLKTKYGYEMYCPKKNCQGSAIEVDELFLLPIIILNKKGYSTKFCCSGHHYSELPNAYILFEDDIYLPSIPKGYTRESNNCIRKYFDKSSNEIVIHKEIVKSSIDVLDWVNKLKIYEDLKEF